MTVNDYIAALTAASRWYNEEEVRGVAFAVGKYATCIDMAQKLRRFGQFASERQKGFAEKLILWACPNPTIALTPERRAQIGGAWHAADWSDRSPVSPAEQRQHYAELVPGFSEYIAQRRERAVHLDPNGGQQATPSEPGATSAQPEATIAPSDQFAGLGTEPGPAPVFHIDPVIGLTCREVIGSVVPPQTAHEVDTGPALRRIRSLFAAATNSGLRRPRIVVSIDGMRLRLYPGTRNPLATNVRLLEGGASTYVGFITADGQFVERDAGVGRGAEITRRIVAFGTAPEDVARAHGLATGNCCFCQRELTDQRSVAMGYGPICAEHYGLAWGNQRARPVEVTSTGAHRGVAQRIPPLVPAIGPAADEARRVRILREARARSEDIAMSNAAATHENEQERAAYEAEMERDIAALSAEARAAGALDDEDRIFHRRR